MWINAGRIPYNPDGWTVQRMIQFVQYTDPSAVRCPVNVAECRWRGMCAWYVARERDQDWECS